MTELVERAAELIVKARHVVALTGAGISTPSGIPDFRTPGTGLWARFNPLEVATIYAFRNRPSDFFDWIRPLAKQMLEAQPNPAHRALAELQAAGHLTTVITQNIDGLHQRAGTRDVIEIHGNIEAATCMHCYRVYPRDRFLTALIDDGTLPICPTCGGVLKPNVILFGEALPVQALMAAKRAASTCDLLLVAGSSLEVAPASDLPMLAVTRQARVIIVNQEPTYLDHQGDVVIHDDIAEVLPEIAAAARTVAAKD
jgi:NAD-dependent deacetylase